MKSNPLHIIGVRQDISSEVIDETLAQDAKWGQQDHPSVLPSTFFPGLPSEQYAKDMCKLAFERGKGTFTHIVYEEFLEAVHAKNELERRAELVQLAACVYQWIQAIDRRLANGKYE
jgi:hypothetical protein